MRRKVFASACVLVLAGCGVVLGLDPPTYDGPLKTGGGGDLDGGDAGAPLVIGKLDDVTRWESFTGPGPGYIAGPFDGRFVYFVRTTDVDGPDAGLTGSRVLRYDTTSTAGFDKPDGWTSFDPEVSLATTGPHLAAVMDGKYLVIPANQDHIFLRFDTTQSPNDFTFSSSWETYDSSLTIPGAGFNTALPTADGGTFFDNGVGYTPTQHTGDSFDAGWVAAQFDGGTFPTPCGATFGGTCAGGSLFLGPAGSDTVACLARHTTAGGPGDGWDSVDMNTLGDEFAFFEGVIRSDQHLYFTQYGTRDASAPVKIARKPIEGSLDAGWESQPTNTKNALTRGFLGGAYDGRFVYFAPYSAPTQNAIFSRFDTTLGFNDPTAWDVAAGAALGIPGNRYWGAVFDGQYVYYPSYSAFDGETPAFARFRAYDTKIAVPPVCKP